MRALQPGRHRSVRAVPARTTRETTGRRMYPGCMNPVVTACIHPSASAGPARKTTTDRSGGPCGRFSIASGARGSPSTFSKPISSKPRAVSRRPMAGLASDESSTWMGHSHSSNCCSSSASACSSGTPSKPSPATLLKGDPGSTNTATPPAIGATRDGRSRRVLAAAAPSAIS